MGLIERRIQEEFVKTRMPEALKKIKESSKGAMDKVSVVVDWDSFGDDTAAYQNLSSIWQQTLYGVEAVCQDDLGRESVKHSLKKILIKNVKTREEVKAEFKKGTLTAYFDAAQGTNGSPGWTAFQQALEEAL